MATGKYLSIVNGLPVLYNGTVPTPIVTVSGTKTLALTDANTFQNCTSTSATTISIPTNASVAFTAGTEIEINQDGTGAVAIAAASGVNIRRGGSTATTNHVLIGQYYSAILKYIGSDEWRIYGDLQ